jgi:hypothetical protein
MIVDGAGLEMETIAEVPLGVNSTHDHPPVVGAPPQRINTALRALFISISHGVVSVSLLPYSPDTHFPEIPPLAFHSATLGVRCATGNK